MYVCNVYMYAISVRMLVWVCGYVCNVNSVRKLCVCMGMCELLGIRAEVEFARIWAETEVESSSTARIFRPLRILTSHNGSQNPHRREYSARWGFCEPLWACIGLRRHLTLQNQYPERRRRSDTTNTVLPAPTFAEALDHAEDFANRYGLPPWPLRRIQD